MVLFELNHCFLLLRAFLNPFIYLFLFIFRTVSIDSWILILFNGFDPWLSFDAKANCFLKHFLSRSTSSTRGILPCEPQNFQLFFVVALLFYLFIFCFQSLGFILFFWFFKINFYWSIVDLQCCVSFCYTTKWISYTYTYIHSFLDSFPI